METIISAPQENNSDSAQPQTLFSRRPMLAFCVLIAVNAMWAFQFSGARIATRELGGVLVTLLPMVIATLLVLPFAKLNLGLFSVANRSILIDIVLLGTLGIVPAQLGLVFGVERTLASNGSVLALTVPVLTALSAFLFLHEHMTRLRWLSFVIALVGVYLISAQDIEHARLFQLQYMSGNLLILVSCMGSAFYNSFSRRALARFSAAQVLVLSFIVADVELLALLLAVERGSWRQLAHLEPSVWSSLVLVAVFSLGLSMLLYFLVIQSVEVMRAALSIYLLPVFGVLFSALLLGEQLTPVLIAGGVLIFVSCFLVTVYEERQRLHTVDGGKNV
jgi:drug/metabolite transporter (DMT)-like permease